MKIHQLAYLLPLAAVLMFSACDKDDDNTNNSGSPTPTPTGPGKVTVNISNVAGMVNVDETGATNYTNAVGEQFSVNMFKYYLSNFELLTDSGSYSVPNTYFLVDESDISSTKLDLPNVPAGSYKGVRFMVGVDFNRYNDYLANPYTGDLDPVNGMFWNWNSGFIHLKLEGNYSDSSSTSQPFVFHIGGMSGVNAGQRIVEVMFSGDSLIVNGARKADIHLLADVLNIFTGSSNITIASNSNLMMVNAKSASIANNYAGMFRFDHLHN